MPQGILLYTYCVVIFAVDLDISMGFVLCSLSLNLYHLPFLCLEDFLHHGFRAISSL